MSRKPNLNVRWSKRERALLYEGEKPTSGMLASFFERIEYLGKMTLAAELDAARL